MNINPKYRVGDIVRIKDVPYTSSHIFITKVDTEYYHMYFMCEPVNIYRYKFSEVDNEDTSYLLSR